MPCAGGTGRKTPDHFFLAGFFLAADFAGLLDGFAGEALSDDFLTAGLQAPFAPAFLTGLRMVLNWPLTMNNPNGLNIYCIAQVL